MPPPPTRPATISELATAAADTSSNSNADLKSLLRRAEGHRRTGGVYMARTTGGSSGTATSTDIGLDLERAFIEYARVATLIVETVPAHREYSTGLNAEQRANLKAVSALSGFFLNTCFGTGRSGDSWLCVYCQDVEYSLRESAFTRLAYIANHHSVFHSFSLTVYPSPLELDT
jgi:STAM-binding protein